MARFIRGFKLFLIIILLILLTFGTVLSIQYSLQENGKLVFKKEPILNGVLRKYAYISGEVANPGIYEIHEDMRVSELIEKAGGFTENADSEFIAKEINLAKKLSDEEKVFIKSKEETKAVISNQNSSLININLASQAELETLPGIGPSTADKIIQNRPYLSIEGILDVPGIGESKFNQIKDLISI